MCFTGGEGHLAQWNLAKDKVRCTIRYSSEKLSFTSGKGHLYMSRPPSPLESRDSRHPPGARGKQRMIVQYGMIIRKLRTALLLYMSRPPPPLESRDSCHTPGARGEQRMIVQYFAMCEKMKSTIESRTTTNVSKLH
jgi:hypothetical protein